MYNVSIINFKKGSTFVSYNFEFFMLEEKLNLHCMKIELFNSVYDFNPNSVTNSTKQNFVYKI